MSEPETNTPGSEIDRVRKVYEGRDGSGAKQRYAWFQPDVIQRQHHLDRALAIFLKEAYGENLSNMSALDVGCGTGGFLRSLVDYGVDPRRLIGTEFLPDRLEQAQAMSVSGIRWVHGDLESITGQDKFDLVSAFTVFSSVLDDAHRKKLAGDMWDKVLPGGWVLIFDFAINNPRNQNVRKVTVEELNGYWPSERWVTKRLILAPPVARRLTKISYAASEFLSLIPLLRSHFIYMVQKPV
ncbi:MAG: class I SAM-dependent methyltransferase [Gammaproteobacteria bacterium]|nr:class I SAM-dependent methyltransferase [Gammaproteobacteria bacterium]